MNGPISALPSPRDLLILIPLPCHSPCRSDMFLDMLSMKNENCAVMLLYTSNKEGDAADQAMAFLEHVPGRLHTLDEGGQD